MRHCLSDELSSGILEPKETLLRRLSALLAIFAAIMLVIGGAPTFALAAPCDPCPPDCAMMMEAAAKAAAHHGQDSQQQGQPDTPCKATLVCATAVAPPILPEQIAFGAPVAQVVHLQILSDRSAPSRPPDRELRPPIAA
jgi:hypothetical protein